MYYPILVIALSRFLVKGWFTLRIECCTLLLVVGSCLHPYIFHLEYSCQEMVARGWMECLWYLGTTKAAAVGHYLPRHLC